MKFKTVKEMEAELKNITSLKSLEEDITFNSQGETITVKYVGTGSSSESKEIAYLGDETPDTVRVDYNGDGDSITVTNVKITRV